MNNVSGYFSVAACAGYGQYRLFIGKSSVGRRQIFRKNVRGGGGCCICFLIAGSFFVRIWKFLGGEWAMGYVGLWFVVPPLMVFFF